MFVGLLCLLACCAVVFLGCCVVSIGNSIISSAITDKQARAVNSIYMEG